MQTLPATIPKSIDDLIVSDSDGLLLVPCSPLVRNFITMNDLAEISSVGIHENPRNAYPIAYAFDLHKTNEKDWRKYRHFEVYRGIKKETLKAYGIIADTSATSELYNWWTICRKMDSADDIQHVLKVIKSHFEYHQKDNYFFEEMLKQ